MKKIAKEIIENQSLVDALEAAAAATNCASESASLTQKKFHAYDKLTGLRSVLSHDQAKDVDEAYWQACALTAAVDLLADMEICQDAQQMREAQRLAHSVTAFLKGQVDDNPINAGFALLVDSSLGQIKGTENA